MLVFLYMNIFHSSDEPELAPMTTGSARGWTGTYTWVRLPVTLQNQSLDRVSEPLAWSSKQYGSSGARWFEKGGRFYFRDAEDLTMFLLRWS
jgi:hypothetical protein